VCQKEKLISKNESLASRLFVDGKGKSKYDETGEPPEAEAIQPTGVF